MFDDIWYLDVRVGGRAGTWSLLLSSEVLAEVFMRYQGAGRERQGCVSWRRRTVLSRCLRNLN